MSWNDWSADAALYELSDGFSIRRAEPAEWGRYCSVYYHMAYNGFFREDPLLRLYVMEGNDAEAVYFNLGFVPGVQEIQSMSLPAEFRESECPEREEAR